VHIHTGYDPETFFPAQWREPALELVAQPIHPRDVEILIPVLAEFLSSHPEAVMQENLENIYLLGKLSFKGKEYGGTHQSKSIYVVWDRTRKYDPPFVLRRLHSEFSSILFDYQTFPGEAWEKLNPDGFAYSGTGFEMLDDPDMYKETDEDAAEGFLCKYSRSSLENDFNMISAELFTQPEALEKRAAQYPLIRHKLELSKNFYRSLSDEYAFRP